MGFGVRGILGAVVRKPPKEAREPANDRTAPRGCAYRQSGTSRPARTALLASKLRIHEFYQKSRTPDLFNRPQDDGRVDSHLGGSEIISALRARHLQVVASFGIGLLSKYSSFPRRRESNPSSDVFPIACEMDPRLRGNDCPRQRAFRANDTTTHLRKTLPSGTGRERIPRPDA